MRSKKKYTNLTFTKRVDHEAGHNTDKRISEPAICEECGAIYTKGRWTLDEKVLDDDPFNKIEPQKTTCPACVQIKTGIPAGFVYIKGNFFNEHKEEIENLLKNEEEKIGLTNPLARIMEFKRSKKRMTITTTTEHLAQHFGRVLKNAYSGDVRYDFSHENKLARVYWERED
jgi:NMD protein affecting ribosome stability and mRNA decay